MRNKRPFPFKVSGRRRHATLRWGDRGVLPPDLFCNCVGVYFAHTGIDFAFEREASFNLMIFCDALERISDPAHGLSTGVWAAV